MGSAKRAIKEGIKSLWIHTGYPHPKGGKDPFGDFQGGLDAVDASPEELEGFYSRKFEFLMGL